MQNLFRRSVSVSSPFLLPGWKTRRRLWLRLQAPVRRASALHARQRTARSPSPAVRGAIQARAVHPSARAARLPDVAPCRNIATGVKVARTPAQRAARQRAAVQLCAAKAPALLEAQARERTEPDARAWGAAGALRNRARRTARATDRN